MFTERKMFSSSFVISAASGVATTTTSSQISAYSARARSEQASVSPPTTFGVVRIVWSVRPGSMRSGEKARWKSLAGREPRLLEDRPQALARGAGVGGRLEHHQLALAQHGGERPRRRR